MCLCLPLIDVGFEIPNRFVVGYALDYNEYFRDLNVSLLTPLHRAHKREGDERDAEKMPQITAQLLSLKPKLTQHVSPPARTVYRHCRSSSLTCRVYKYLTMVFIHLERFYWSWFTFNVTHPPCACIYGVLWVTAYLKYFHGSEASRHECTGQVM